MSNLTLFPSDKLIKLRDVEVMFEEVFERSSMPSRTTIVGWIEDGTLDGVQLGSGRNYYVRRSSIEKFFQRFCSDSFQQAA